MLSILKSMKFSANIPEDLLQFLDRQVSAGHYRSRSAALTDALQGWRSERLRTDYAAAFADIDGSWDTTLQDGLFEQEL